MEQKKEETNSNAEKEYSDINVKLSIEMNGNAFVRLILLIKSDPDLWDVMKDEFKKQMGKYEIES